MQLTCCFVIPITLSGHFSILTGQQAKQANDTKYHLHMREPSLLTDISAAPHPQQIAMKIIYYWRALHSGKWRARIGIRNALRTRSPTTEGIPTPKCLVHGIALSKRAWPLQYLLLSILKPYTSPLHLNSSFRVSAFHVVSLTFCDCWNP